MDKLDAVLRAFVGCQDVDGVHNACRLVWNAALPLLDQKPSKQVKRTMTSAAQALASVASPLHGLRWEAYAPFCGLTNAWSQVGGHILHSVASPLHGRRWEACSLLLEPYLLHVV